MILGIGLRPKRLALVLNLQLVRRVMDDAVAVIVIANGAVQIVVMKDPIESFTLRNIRAFAAGSNNHARRHNRSTRANQFPIHLDEACVASLDWSELRVVTYLRKPAIRRRSIDGFDQKFARNCTADNAVKQYRRVVALV